jgi:hypothetical protein
MTVTSKFLLHGGVSRLIGAHLHDDGSYHLAVDSFISGENSRHVGVSATSGLLVNAPFSTGLTVVTTGAGAKITVTYE